MRNTFKIILYLSILITTHCTDQRHYCNESVRRSRKGGNIEGDAKSLCLGYVVLENSAKRNEDRGQPSSFSRFLADQNLVGCLYKILEERKCENQSEYIPHFGY